MAPSNSIYNDSRLYGNTDARTECSNIHTFNNVHNNEPWNSNCTECQLSRNSPAIAVRGSCQPYVLQQWFQEPRGAVYASPRGSYANANDYQYGVYGYHDGDRLECCVGMKSDNISCAPCWCPQSNDPNKPCINALNKYCSERNSNKKFKIFDANDEICKRYIQQRPIQAEELKKSLCNQDDVDNVKYLNDAYSNESNSGCVKYCKDGSVNPQSGIYCDANVKKFCSVISIEQAKNENACACFMPNSFYDKLVLDMKEYLGLATKSVISNPVCLYPKCTQSELKPSRIIPCQSVVSCTNNIEINNDGSINNISTNSTNRCVEQQVAADGSLLPPVDNKSVQKNEPTPTPTPTPTPEKSEPPLSITGRYELLTKTDKMIIMGILSFFLLLFFLVVISLLK